MFLLFEEVDGVLVDAQTGESYSKLPRTSEWGGVTAYVIGRPDWRALTRLCGPGDTVAGPSPGIVAGIKWRTAKGMGRLIAGSAWGIQDQEDLEELQEEWEEESSRYGWGPRWPSTAGSAATRALGRHLAQAGEQQQLPPRWRVPSLQGGHTGAAVALRSSTPSGKGIELDRVAAYLQELRGPLPVRGSWHSTWGATRSGWWDRHRLNLNRDRGRRLTLVTAHVRIPPVHAGGFDLLPIRGALGGTRWGGTSESGAIGIWPSAWLAKAEEVSFCEVISVQDAVSCELRPFLRPLADEIERVEHKPLRKLLYTRAVGMLAYRGWCKGKVTGDGIEWTKKPGLLSTKVPRVYRPDIAGLMWSRNAIRLATLIGQLHGGGLAVAAAHVDAVWCERPNEIPKGWQVKAEGDLRVYGVGQYDIGDKSGRMGGERKPAPVHLRKYLLSTTDGEWSDDPVTNDSALYRTRPVQAGECPSLPHSQDRAWQWGGWVKKGREVNMGAINSSMICNNDQERRV